MNCYPTQSNYPGTEPSSPCPILIMPSTRLGSYTYQFYNHQIISPRFQSLGLEPGIFGVPNLTEREANTIYICQRLIYIYVYMKTSFGKRIKLHSKIWACNANDKFACCALGKSFLRAYAYMGRYL